MRADSNYRQLPLYYTNGYILQSYFHAAGKFHPQVLCSFPIDGYTARRPDGGCGAYPGFPTSQACHLNGIITAAQWWADYDSHSGNRYTQQCGFDVSDSRNVLAGPAFNASVASRAYFATDESRIQNELILQAWEDGLGKTLPLEAFFYRTGSTAGLADARRNQVDLHTTDGVLIPIIKVTLAASQDGSASFAYSPEDQAVPMPSVADVTR